MTDFSHLDDLKVTADTTAEYKIHEIQGSPALILRSANEGNSGYTNGLLRLTGQGRGQRRAKIKIDAKTMDDMRTNDRELFPAHVIVGWTGVKDANHAPVKFCKGDCANFINALPDWIFDGVRAFANDPENFVTQIDSEELAGN
jgi:hypothetical protein